LCTPAKTTEVQVKNTLQLEAEFEIWQRNLENLVTTQNAYLNSICEWLVLHIIEIESDGKQGPVYPSSSLVYELAKAWFDALKHVNGNASVRAMKEFSNRIRELKIQQTEEIKQKKRLDQLQKQLEKKEHALKVHMMKQDEKQSEEGINTTGSSATKAIEASVKLLKERVDFEKDEYEKMCVKSGNMTLVILQKGLPPVLKSMKDFANNFFQHYTNLFFLKKPVGDQKQSAPSSMLQITL
jgi:co-chaperonin GroES (HSP10)